MILIFSLVTHYMTLIFWLVMACYAMLSFWNVKLRDLYFFLITACYMTLIFWSVKLHDLKYSTHYALRVLNFLALKACYVMLIFRLVTACYIMLILWIVTLCELIFCLAIACYMTLIFCTVRLHDLKFLTYDVLHYLNFLARQGLLHDIHFLKRHITWP